MVDVGAGALAVTAALFAGFKEFAEGRGVGLIGADFDGVHVGGAKEAEEIGLVLGAAVGEGGEFAAVVGVDFDDFAGFGVGEDEAPSAGRASS